MEERAAKEPDTLDTVDVALVDVPDDLIAGVLFAEGVQIGPSEPGLVQEVEATLAAGPSDGDVQGAIRDLLRTKAYKPTGRGKPASEYLLRAAAEGRFPFINNVVDINNLASVQTGWPWSVLDRERALADAEGFELRRGRQGESYVFNSAGQSIELEGLLLVARAGGAAVGNPVKDAMEAKTTDATRRLVAFAYASRRVATEGDVQRALDRFAERLRSYARGRAFHTRVLSAPSPASR